MAAAFIVYPGEVPISVGEIRLLPREQRDVDVKDPKLAEISDPSLLLRQLLNVREREPAAIVVPHHPVRILVSDFQAAPQHGYRPPEFGTEAERVVSRPA
jgi:hypothetical protein